MPELTYRIKILVSRFLNDTIEKIKTRQKECEARSFIIHQSSKFVLDINRLMSTLSYLQKFQNFFFEDLTLEWKMGNSVFDEIFCDLDFSVKFYSF